MEPAGAAPEAPPEALHRGGRALPWHLLLGADLAVAAALLVLQLWAGAILLLDPDSPAAERIRDGLTDTTRGSLWANALLSFAMFGAVPFLWVLGTRVRPWPGAPRFLQMRDPLRSAAKGALLALPLVAVVGGLSFLYLWATEGADALTGDTEANPAVQGILESLDWPLVVGIAVLAGVGEEILFRGVLQKWLGVWGQAALFGLFHAAGGYPPQIAGAFAIGVLFGILVRRGSSLWTVIAAHVTYDFLLLGLALLAG